MRERESERAAKAREWYETVTGQPTQLGRRIALALTKLGIDAKHEVSVSTPYSRVRTDVLVQRPVSQQNQLIVELNAFGPDGTMPSSIKDAIRIALRRHARLACRSEVSAGLRSWSSRCSVTRRLS